MNREQEVIWAPWRKSYVVRADKGRSCVFCRASRARDDRKHLVVARGAGCFLVLNPFPYNNGHLLAVPNRHIKDLEELSDSEARELFTLTLNALSALRQTLAPAGFNVGLNLGSAAGAGIAEHLHLHLVPRWDGDTNFMPVTGKTKVLPDSLDALYRTLRQALKNVHR